MNMEQAVNGALTISGLTTREELEFLYKLVKLAPAGWIVELGSFRGRSGFILCTAAKPGSQVLLIDNFSHHDYTDKELLRTNLFEMGYTPLIVDGDSSVIPPFFPRDASVGLLFIDSEHTKGHYNAECDAWLPRVVSGGIVASHDYGGPHCPEITAAIDSQMKPFKKIRLVRRLIAYQL